VYNNVSQKILQIKTEQEITTQIDLMSKQTVELKCAYCGHVNAIPIELSIDNKFECEECGKTNAVYVAITTAQKTEIPDSIDRTKVTTLIQQELEAKREFLNGQT
jgi:transposase-like protein